jgi:hypothetical protein
MFASLKREYQGGVYSIFFASPFPNEKCLLLHLLVPPSSLPPAPSDGFLVSHSAQRPERWQHNQHRRARSSQRPRKLKVVLRRAQCPPRCRARSGSNATMSRQPKRSVPMDKLSCYHPYCLLALCQANLRCHTLTCFNTGWTKDASQPRSSD